MKTQNSKKSPPLNKLPSNSRFITEYFNGGVKSIPEGIFFVFLITIFLLLIAMSLMSVFVHMEQYELLQAKHKEIQSKIVFWEDTVRKYSNFRDGYFSLALLEYQRRNKEKANIYLQDALILDPNFENGRVLERILKEEN